MAVKITLGNAKGGVGKTLITNFLAYHLAEMDYKVLVIDCDPQGNTTGLFEKKIGSLNEIQTLYQGLKNKNLKSCIKAVSDNLAFISSSTDLVKLDDLLKGQKDKVSFFAKQIVEFNDEYDFIFFDVPPSPYSIYVNNALGASDYFGIITEIGSDSFKGIPTFYEVANNIHENFNKNLEFLGIIVNRRENDVETFAKIDSEYNLEGDEFFVNYIPKRSRLFKYMEHGVYNYTVKKGALNPLDRWDLELYAIGEKLAKELLGKLELGVK
ncbi:ParA family protein [Lysinibacillus sp. NPDC096418]|uniref:ParA family protein n=1 Tax=Lysinibacillus sp. NPDC096418 TaxID=3364138 RepID=UPI0037FD27F2